MSKIRWPHQEAKKLESRTRNHDAPVVFETGYGPSGLPHIGTFAEVARTVYVMNAFASKNPDRKLKLIVFSDDMDGLRSIPENVPNHELLKAHLGSPLSKVPDPFGVEKSYSMNMNDRLCQFLDHYGFDYEFRSSTDCYNTGIFNDGLKRVMANYESIRSLFVNTIAEDKRDAWSPFFPICEICGKIYTTRVVSIYPDTDELSYSCDLDNDAYKACGHTNRLSILDGRVKVGWKIDWALRWFTFKVNYEMHGKDLMDSAALSSKICKILSGRPPLTYKYELFLDENGAKISKKIGNGVSMEQWQAYAPVGALLLFLLENPNKARKMGLPILPRLVDNYLVALHDTSIKEPDSPLWFVDKLLHHHDASLQESSDIQYSLLVNVAETLGHGGAELLYEFAKRYDLSVAENEQFFRELCGHVIAYVEGVKVHNVDPVVSKPDVSLFPYLIELRQSIGQLNTQGEFSHEALQNAVFKVAKNHNLDFKEWFHFLYLSLLQKEQGPRLGSFFAMLGFDKVDQIFDQAIQTQTSGSTINFGSENLNTPDSM